MRWGRAGRILRDHEPERAKRGRRAGFAWPNLAEGLTLRFRRAAEQLAAEQDIERDMPWNSKN